jgi:hypothetical protein
MKKLRRYFRPSRASNADGITGLTHWSIGILTGKSLDSLREPDGVKNPVLSIADITDRRAIFLADPFLFRGKDHWHLFFELFDAALVRGVIGHATSKDGLCWKYQGVVLQDDVHLSYPYVFESDGEIYLIPETKKAREVRLYRATNFPNAWKFEKVLLHGRFADASVVKYENRWWMFAAYGAYSLCIYHADKVEGPWRRHLWPRFYFRNKSKARPGGRALVRDGKIIRFVQDAKLRYGHQLRAFEVDILTRNRFKEHEILDRPVLTPGTGEWNCIGMHHMDAQQLADGSLLAIVDGARPPLDEAVDGSLSAQV